MSDNTNEEQTVDGAPISAVPNPKAVKDYYEGKAKEAGAAHDETVQGAKDKLADEKAANGFFAKRAEFGEKRQTVDTEFETTVKALDTQASTLDGEIKKLLQKGKQLETGTLRKAQKRKEAEAKAIKAQISELTELRNVLVEVQDLGIELPTIDLDGDGDIDEADKALLDVNGDGVLDVNDIEAIDAKIAELEEKVANDPVLNLVTQQIAVINKATEARQAQLGQAKEAKATARTNYKQTLTDLKEGIAKDHETRVTSATEAFNQASGARAEAINEVKAAAAPVIAQEQADAAEYASNSRADSLQTTYNTAAGGVTGIYQAVIKAWKTLVESIKAGYDEQTPGAKANEELLAKRQERIGTPKP